MASEADLSQLLDQGNGNPQADYRPGGDPGGRASLGKPDLEQLWLQFTVESFYRREAELLDSRHFDEWLMLFASDATYEVPLRVTTEDGGDSEVSSRGRIYWDTRTSLGVRIERLQSGYAWVEQPPTRTRHFVTNIRVSRVADGFIETQANLLVACNRGDEPAYVLYSGERKDRLTQGSQSDYVICSRVVVVDQANMAGNALSVFL